MKLLTVVVPCKNSEAYLKKCLDSLIVGGENIEVIIVNDGSSDNTGKIADTYSTLFPSIVKVIHQKNGGHGDAINQGLKHATGFFFKVVDSDDCLSNDLNSFIQKLFHCKSQNIDLVITNYRYTHSNINKNKSINYSNAFKPNKVISWKNTRPLLPHQMLTIHSCTIRTQILKDINMSLPKHTYYEDNLMICWALPQIEKLYYINSDLYLYTIGREGQSMQENILSSNYSHQLRVTKESFAIVSKFTPKTLLHRIFLHHELFLLFGMASCVARTNNTPKAETDLKQMWKECQKINHKKANHFLYRTPILLLNIPGKFGKRLTIFIYRLANKIIPFN